MAFSTIGSVLLLRQRVEARNSAMTGLSDSEALTMELTEKWGNTQVILNMVVTNKPWCTGDHTEHLVLENLELLHIGLGQT